VEDLKYLPHHHPQRDKVVEETGKEVSSMSLEDAIGMIDVMIIEISHEKMIESWTD
jgi:hypothetical protein